MQEADVGKFEPENDTSRKLEFVAALDREEEWRELLLVFGYMLAHPERNFKKDGVGTEEIHRLLLEGWSRDNDGEMTRAHADKMIEIAGNRKIGETILAVRKKIEATLSYIVTPLVGVDGRMYIEIGKGVSLPESSREAYPSLWDHVVLGLIAEKYPDAIVFSKTVNPAISKRYEDRKFVELSCDDFAKRFPPESQTDEGVELCEYIWGWLNGGKRMFVAPVPAGELAEHVRAALGKS